jgi:hypothetical protein
MMPVPLVVGAATLRAVDTWRCPHCGTTQADGPRCWACSRYPVACGSCQNFRRAVAGRFGYCCLDRGRATLQGDEVRACWQPPDRTTSYEGLFRELTPTPEPPPADGPVTARTTEDPDERTRTWAVPVHGDSVDPSLGVARGGAAPGLVEAIYVPARRPISSVERGIGAGPELLDLEVQRLVGGAATPGQLHPGSHAPVTSGGPLAGDADP